jgi:hypothetical protein
MQYSTDFIKNNKNNSKKMDLFCKRKLKNEGKK